MKWLFGCGGGVMSAAGGEAFTSPPAGWGVTPKDMLLYVGLSRLTVWRIALLIAAGLQMRQDRRESAHDAMNSE